MGNRSETGRGGNAMVLGTAFMLVACGPLFAEPARPTEEAEMPSTERAGRDGRDRSGEVRAVLEALLEPRSEEDVARLLNKLQALWAEPRISEWVRAEDVSRLRASGRFRAQARRLEEIIQERKGGDSDSENGTAAIQKLLRELPPAKAFDGDMLSQDVGPAALAPQPTWEERVAEATRNNERARAQKKREEAEWFAAERAAKERTRPSRPRLTPATLRKDIALDPGGVAEVRAGKLDLAGLLARSGGRLDSKNAEAFQAAIRGLSMDVSSLRQAEIVHDRADGVHRLKLAFGDAKSQGRVLFAQRLSGAEDGQVRVIDLGLGPPPVIVRYAADFTRAWAEIPDPAHRAMGLMKLVPAEEWRLDGDAWIVRNLEVAPYEEKSWTPAWLAEGMEYAFSPFQTAIYTLAGFGGVVANEAIHRTIEVAPLRSAYMKATARYTLLQARASQYSGGSDLRTEKGLSQAYHDFIIELGGEEQAALLAFLDDYVRARKERSLGSLAFLTRGDDGRLPVADAERAAALAGIAGLASASKVFADLGAASWRNGNLPETVFNYGASAAAAVAPAAGEGLGFGPVSALIKAGAAVQLTKAITAGDSMRRALVAGRLLRQAGWLEAGLFTLPGAADVADAVGRAASAARRGDADLAAAQGQDAWNKGAPLAGLLWGLTRGGRPMAVGEALKELGIKPELLPKDLSRSFERIGDRILESWRHPDFQAIVGAFGFVEKSRSAPIKRVMRDGSEDASAPSRLHPAVEALIERHLNAAAEREAPDMGPARRQQMFAGFIETLAQELGVGLEVRPLRYREYLSRVGADLADLAGSAWGALRERRWSEAATNLKYLAGELTGFLLQVDPPLTVSRELPGGGLGLVVSPAPKLHGPSYALITALAGAATGDPVSSLAVPALVAGAARLLPAQRGHELSHAYQMLLLEWTRQRFHPEIPAAIFQKLVPNSALQTPVHGKAGGPRVGDAPPDPEKLAAVARRLFEDAFRNAPAAAAGPRLRDISRFNEEVKRGLRALEPGQPIYLKGSQAKATVVAGHERLYARRDHDDRLLPLTEIAQVNGMPLIRETLPDGREVVNLYRAINIDHLDAGRRAALLARIRSEGLESAGMSEFGGDVGRLAKRIKELWPDLDIRDQEGLLEATRDSALKDPALGRSITPLMPFSSDPSFVSRWATGAGGKRIIVKVQLPAEHVDRLFKYNPAEAYESEYTFRRMATGPGLIAEIFAPTELLREP